MKKIAMVLLAVVIMVGCSAPATGLIMKLDRAEPCSDVQTTWIPDAPDEVLDRYFVNGHESDVLAGVVCDIVKERDGEASSVFVLLRMGNGSDWRFWMLADAAMPPTNMPIVLAIKRYKTFYYIHAFAVVLESELPQ